MIEEDKLRQRVERIAALVRRLEAVADAEVRAQSKELLESVMDLHGEALERMLQRLRGSEPGQAMLGDLAADPVVSSVLLLYNLHPVDFDTRVRNAVEKLQPALRSYGISAELLALNGGAVRIRLRGVDSSHTARNAKSAIEEAIYAAAPDAASLVILGLENFAAPDFVPLEKVGTLAGTLAGTPAGKDRLP